MCWSSPPPLTKKTPFNVAPRRPIRGEGRLPTSRHCPCEPYSITYGTLNNTRRSKQCKSLIWIIILFSVLICYRICREEQLSRGTLLRGRLLRRTLLWGILRDIDIWWYWVNIGRYWLVFGGTGSVWGSTGWYLVILGQFNLVLFGIKWYWVIKGLLCLYILKKLMVTSTDQPTNQPTDRVNIEQSAFFES